MSRGGRSEKRAPGPALYSWRVGTPFLLGLEISHLPPPHTHASLCKSLGSGYGNSYGIGQGTDKLKKLPVSFMDSKRNDHRTVLASSRTGGWALTLSRRSLGTVPSSSPQSPRRPCAMATSEASLVGWPLWLDLEARDE